MTAPNPNLVAIENAGLDFTYGGWFEQIEALVDERLEAVREDWRELPAAATLRPAVFGLLLAMVVRQYPETREHVNRVAEAHPSFLALPATRRLATLEQICASETLVLEWLGPLLDADDPARVRPLCVFSDERP